MKLRFLLVLTLCTSLLPAAASQAMHAGSNPDISIVVLQKQLAFHKHLRKTAQKKKISAQLQSSNAIAQELAETVIEKIIETACAPDSAPKTEPSSVSTATTVTQTPTSHATLPSTSQLVYKGEYRASISTTNSVNTATASIVDSKAQDHDPEQLVVKKETTELIIIAHHFQTPVISDTVIRELIHADEAAQRVRTAAGAKHRFCCVIL